MSVTPLSPARSTRAASQSIVDRNSEIAKEMEVLSQFMFRAEIRGTFLFFGSARTQCEKDFTDTVQSLQAALDAANAAGDVAGAAKAEGRLTTVRRRAWACETFERCRDLARILAEWAATPEGRNCGLRCSSKFDTTLGMRSGDAVPLIVCTGGGPGFMEAGNMGAHDAGARSMGVGIVLPFETKLNAYVTPGLGIEAQFFYSRKVWEVLAAKAIIVAPGGVGTLDELFEVMTLLQCGKMQPVPIVLLGVDFWTRAVDLKYVADMGMMSHEEIDQLCITDSPDEAFQFIRTFLVDEAQRNISPTKRDRDASMN